MDILSSLTAYFKEAAQSIRFQISAALAFLCSLFVLWLVKGGTSMVLRTVPELLLAPKRNIEHFLHRKAPPTAFHLESCQG